MLVAPLNWGLGHATRCIPIIHALIKNDFEPILASDGNALLLLQKEFPLLKSYTLPSYNIKYAKSSKRLKLKLLLSVPSVFLAVKKEQKFTQKIIEKETIEGVISDNRFGVYASKIPSVYITHQVNVLSGNLTKLTSIFHQKIIKKFDECWVPDVEFETNVSGKLSCLKNSTLKIKYIGALSRLKKIKTELKYDLLILLSGPEPQRSILENKLLNELKNYEGKVLFVRGVLNDASSIKTTLTIEIKNYLLSNEVEKAMNESRLMIARSGYSTIMDVAALGKKVFFIPTPGQNEQEYLAKRLQKQKIAPFSNQQNFTFRKLEEVEKYSGFAVCNTKLDLNLFNLFKGK